MKNNCIFCEGDTAFIFEKQSSSTKKKYKIYECKNCGLWQIHPRVSAEETNELYQKNYFKKRTDRGYDNYNSEKVRQSVEDTFYKNLNDLDFFKWEETLPSCRKSLDIGCAAGYFVEYLHNRKWNSQGIDVAKEMIEAAQKRKLTVYNADFLKKRFETNSYHLVTMWAAIEHLEDPQKFLEKISAILKPGARLILTTCHTGYFAKRKKENWRYLNVPEHMWFFSRKSLEMMGEKHGLKLNRSFTYGSGFTTIENAGLKYRIQKAICDRLAKIFHLGDMIVCEFVRK
ncbi:MAG: class I SAM-dependent methyltransferase [Spirochaetia bacterium]|nr:class I SAM-dependent methyltransferase [Spirochaetia bacterium]